MKFLKHSALIALGFFLVAGSALAQGQKMKNKKDIDVSKKELKQFASLVQKQQEEQRSAMKDIQAMLSDKGMTMQRFQQIMMSKRKPNAADSLKPNKEEQKTMKKIQPKMQKMQQKAQKRIQSAIDSSDLTKERFQAIGGALRSDKDLMMRFQKVMQGGSSR